jgi:hypothetical protein
MTRRLALGTIVFALLGAINGTGQAPPIMPAISWTWTAGSPEPKLNAGSDPHTYRLILEGTLTYQTPTITITGVEFRVHLQDPATIGGYYSSPSYVVDMGTWSTTPNAVPGFLDMYMIGYVTDAQDNRVNFPRNDRVRIYVRVKYTQGVQQGSVDFGPTDVTFPN